MTINHNTTLKIKLKKNNKHDEIELFKSLIIKLEKNMLGSLPQIILSEPEQQLFEKLKSL